MSLSVKVVNRRLALERINSSRFPGNSIVVSSVQLYTLAAEELFPGKLLWKTILDP